jgi:two-component system, chemotaxis family, protein-glutamate methylesterase/glutaminase
MWSRRSTEKTNSKLELRSRHVSGSMCAATVERHVSANNPIKVMIVDDSPTVRAVLARALSDEADIIVIGEAKDPYEARELIIEFRPDVIILDIEMPRMDGLTFLRKLQAHYPVPVIMCSGVASGTSHAALKAIELGAIDFVAKPSAGGNEALKRLGEDLADKIRAAAIAMRNRPLVPAPPVTRRSFQTAGLHPGRYVVAIGASTGGTEAIKELLSNVPSDFPAVAIVQHMPAGFTKSFADRLNQSSSLTVTEAVDGDILEPGKVLVARGGIQMSVGRIGNRLRIVYGTDDLVNRHCPSVDVLFDSVAQYVGSRAVGVLLTGMGADGAKGLLNMKERGAVTIGQNHESCVVYGMPKVAAEIGAVQHTATPGNVSGTLIRALQRRISQVANGYRRSSIDGGLEDG